MKRKAARSTRPLEAAVAPQLSPSPALLLPSAERLLSRRSIFPLRASSASPSAALPWFPLLPGARLQRGHLPSFNASSSALLGQIGSPSTMLAWPPAESLQYSYAPRSACPWRSAPPMASSLGMPQPQPPLHGCRPGARRLAEAPSLHVPPAMDFSARPALSSILSLMACLPSPASSLPIPRSRSSLQLAAPWRSPQTRISVVVLYVHGTVVML
jgi:hypothetical protein